MWKVSKCWNTVKDHFCLGEEEILMDVLIDFKYILSGFFFFLAFSFC